MTRKVLILSVAGAVLLIAGIACHSYGINNGLPTIVGTLTRYKTTAAESTIAAVTVNGSKLVPVVAINGDTLDLTDFEATGEYMWNSTWRSTNPQTDTLCALYVYQDGGEAQSPKQTMPGSMGITAPDTGSTLHEGQDFVASWTAVPKIDRYVAAFHVNYTYRFYYHFTFDTTAVISGSVATLTIPASSIFPAYADSVNLGVGSITVTAETGPNIGREVSGNISGNGIGYFWTRSTDSRAFNVGPH